MRGLDLAGNWLQTSSPPPRPWGSWGVSLCPIVHVEMIGTESNLRTTITELDDGKIYRKALYLMVKTMVSCRFSLKPIH